ncbi:hypothetical protein [Pseudalkalibacillus hwajinpoensis]|uniref:hypothetical protein n=1 Tax=Guptibacillus hwajinpoensis TaxID=208199 RepID=UPI001CFC6EB5|nr:hypothetical protein [Pseudalkalibacillus hwajinpoensis]
MKTLRMVFLFTLLLTVSACNFLTTSDSSEQVEAEKEAVDKSSEEAAQEVLFEEGTYKWEKDGEILGGLDITDPQADSFTFMLQAYDGQNVGELSGIAQVNGETATFTHAENTKCKVSFGWKEDRLAIDTSEACESLNENPVSFTGVYTKIGVSSTSTEEKTTGEEANWQEALYIDPTFDEGNLTITNVTMESFEFAFDVSNGDQVGELTGTATIEGNEATFQDPEDPACSGTFVLSDGAISFIEDSCLNYHDAAVGFNGEYVLSDEKPTATNDTASCEKAPFHSELLQFAEQGHLKDASIFLGMSEEALKKLKPSMTYDEALYEGTPGFYDDSYAYLTADEKVSDLRYNALSEGPAVPYAEVVCQFGEPDEVVFNELDSEYLHVYYAGENKLSFVSDSKEGAIKAVELQTMTVQ